jgi:glycosyltransferase involved in cell wall biosynthesis
MIGIFIGAWSTTLLVASHQRDIGGSAGAPHTMAGAGREGCPAELHPRLPAYEQHDARLVQFSPLNTSAPLDHNDTLLVLTPVSNSQRFFDHYFRLLCSLTYPHPLISIALGEDSSTDGTYEYAQALADQYRPFFRSIDVYQLDPPKMPRIPYGSRHRKELQGPRRGHMAMSRNQLLLRAMEDQDWVLWLDVDMLYYPCSIVEHLLSSRKPVVVPNCLMSSQRWDRYTIYDKNTWRETKASKRLLREAPRGLLQVEGYGPTKRKYLAEIVDEGLSVPLDGVGGCVLLVKGEKHRDGLVFPPFVFNHHIETEGLAKMATEMNISIAGLPFVNTVHS